MKNINYRIWTNFGEIFITIGKTYSGLGYSGMSDGLIVTGKLIEVDVMHDDARLEDDKGMIYTVIPRTLNIIYSKEELRQLKLESL